MTAERQRLLDQVQTWGFVLAGVVAVLTLPVVGLAFGLAAAALGHRNAIPAARWSGLAVLLASALVLALGLGTADGGGLID